MKTKYIGNMRAYEQALMDCEEIMKRIDHVGRVNDDLPFFTRDREEIKNERDLQEKAWEAVKMLHQVLCEATGRVSE